MSELNIENTKAEYSIPAIVDRYISCVDDIGLWRSERLMFSEYLDAGDKILDIGCGAGRTTFELYEMGYTDITGLDLSEMMISAARDIAKGRKLSVPFVVGNACALSYSAGIFDAVVFSFNGIMTIPTRKMRKKAFDEIYRVLKPGGVFIFTTHHMDNPDYFDYWNAECDKWDKSEQDERLFEYGDLIFSKTEEYGDVVNFIHIPPNGEVEACLETSGFELIFNEVRSKICEENAAVMDFSADCMFWVCRK